MSNHLHSAFAIVFVLTTAFTALGDDVSGNPPEAVLSLRNGGILRGRITQLGDRYLVRLSRGGEVRIPVNDVEFVASDLGGVYRFKRQQFRSPRPEEHLRLANWCLTHHLVLRAIDEFEQAKRLDPHCKGLQLTERRLQSATSRRAARKPVQPRPTRTSESRDLPKLVGSLPEGAMHRFTTAIQPLLINRCGGCHGQHVRSKFKIHRGIKGRALPRRFTQMNLYAALQNINRTAPDRSALLSNTIVPHGNSNEAVFTEKNREEFEILRAWARSVVNDKPAARVAKAHDAIPQPNSSFLHQADNKQRGGNKNGKRRSPVQPAGFSSTASRDFNQPQRRDSAVKPATIRRDPFDAEIFNRRFHGKK